MRNRLYLVVRVLSPALGIGLVANIAGNSLPDIDHPLYTFLQVGDSGRFLHPFFLAVGICLMVIGLGLCFPFYSRRNKARFLKKKVINNERK